MTTTRTTRIAEDCWCPHCDRVRTSGRYKLNKTCGAPDCVAAATADGQRAALANRVERRVEAPVERAAPDAIFANGFAAHNLPTRPMPGPLPPRPDSRVTTAGVARYE